MKRDDKSEYGKKKRPERKLYVPPALRSRECGDTMEDTKDYFRGSMSRRTSSLGNIDDILRITNIFSEKARFHGFSSSSNSNLPNKDDDSTDLEECCSVLAESSSDDEICAAANENNPYYHWNNGRKERSAKINHDIETENCQTSSKISNKFLMKYEDDPGEKFPENKLLNFQPNKPTLHRKIFYRSDESSISSIDAIIDDCIGKGGVLTSTPNSDIQEQMILDAANYIPDEESEQESTILRQRDTRETTINKNGAKFDFKFEIYHDPSSVSSPQTDNLESSDNNYIPPPVPAQSFQLPPIHRLPFLVSSPREFSVLRHIPPQKMPKISAQLPCPRLLCASSLRLRPSSSIIHSSPSSIIPLYSSHMPPIPRYVLSPRMKTAALHAPNPSRTFPLSPRTLSPQERFNLSRPPQDALNNHHLYQRNHNPLSLESYKQDDSFYIPPPVPRPQQIRNIDQKESMQSCQSFSISRTNKIGNAGEIWPHNP